jgi:hypothetical protein
MAVADFPAAIFFEAHPFLPLPALILPAHLSMDYSTIMVGNVKQYINGFLLSDVGSRGSVFIYSTNVRGVQSRLQQTLVLILSLADAIYL